MARRSAHHPEPGEGHTRPAGSTAGRSGRRETAREPSRESGRESGRESSRESAARPHRDRRSSRWDEHRRARRRELTAATIVAIREHGPEVGMSQVAAQARTSKTVVYRHFADKFDLYLAVCDLVAKTLVTQLQGAMRDAAENPRRTLEAGIGAYLALIAADPEVYRYVMRPPRLDRPAGEDPVADLCTVIGDHVSEIISTELRRQNRDPAPAMTWGHGLVGMVRAAADQWLAVRPEIERDTLAAQLADLAWAGLARTVTPASSSAS